MAQDDWIVDQSDLKKQRLAARRTAWGFGLIALLIFSAFMLTGFIGR